MHIEDGGEGHAGTVDDESSEEGDDTDTKRPADADDAVIARVFEDGECFLVEDGDIGRLQS